MKHLLRSLAIIGTISLMASATASAHVVVRPSEVETAGFQTFSIGVPNEKTVATTSVRLVVPDGLNYVTPTSKPGWQINVDKSGEGEAAKVTAITWSGGNVPVGFRDDFTFSAQVPDKPTELQWKAYQTYADGTTVSWDKAVSGDDHESEDENAGPLSVTKVVTETDAASQLNAAETAATDARNRADRATTIAVAAVVVGLAGMYVATRKNQS